MSTYKQLLILDFLLRLTGISCFTLFVAAIYQTTGKASDIGMISVATVGPALLITLYANKYTSLFSPLGILKWVNVARLIVFVVSALVASSTSTGLLVAAALQSLIHQMAIGAKMSLDAQVITPEERRAYLSQKNILANIAIVSGPALGGALISFLGAQPTLAVMAIVSSVTVSFIFAIPTIASKKQMSSSAKSVSGIESLLYLRSIPLTAAIVFVFCIVAIILEVQAPLLFPFVHEVYGTQSYFTGFLLGLAGLGGIVGSLCAQKFPNALNERLIPYLVVLDGLLFLFFTFLDSPIPASLVFVTLGIMGAITLIVVEGAIQRDVQIDHQPFIFALMQFAAGAGGAFLGIISGFLAESYGAKAILSSAAVAEIGIGVCLIALVFFLSKSQIGRNIKNEC